MIVEFLFPILLVHGAEIDTAREKARGVLEVHCGACHDPRRGALAPKPLGIFDLSREDWPATMGKRQLRSSLERLRDRSAMTAAELAEVVPRGMARPPNPRREEIAAFRRFVELELRMRAFAGKSAE